MTSQSLYRKWRSQTFDDLVGQAEIVRTLKNALQSGKLSHAYLFTGPRGTGKTSTARLLAKTVNCENPQNGEPCNQCIQCREITAGNSFNVIEIDAASNRGIDSIRELREKVMMPPSTGKYKVYVLDEAHMLTTEAFNALLKTLEEPPEYAIFVMATTDVHKMLPTVLSRCQRFDFKRISTRQIVQHLLFVSQQEKVKLEKSAAELIARAAAGGMRDALSLLDQAIAYCGEEISLTAVQSMLGVADPRAIAKFITFIANLDSSGVLHHIHELAEAGADLRQINTQVADYWRAIMLKRAGADIGTILDLTDEETRDIEELAKHFALDELTECARIFAQNELMQKNQGTPQLGLELAALESIEVHRKAQSGQSIMPTTQQPPAGRTSSATTYTPSRDEETRRVAQPAPPAQPVQPPESRQPAPPKVEVTPSASIEREQKEIVPVAQSGGELPNLSVQQVMGSWENVLKRTGLKSRMLAAYLKYFHVVGIEGTAQQPVVVIQTEKPKHFEYVRDDERYKHLEWALDMEFSLTNCRVRIVPPGQTPNIAAPPAASYSTSVAPPVAPQPPVHIERPAPSTPVFPPAPPSEPPAKSRHEEPPPVPPARNGVGDVAKMDEPPLARSKLVRENKSVMASPEILKQKANQDPVVQEALRIFTAKIVDVRPK